MRKLGMGVLGVGEMGKRHAENLRRLVPHAQLLAVADVDGARAAKWPRELEIEHSYSSLDAMLERKDVRGHCDRDPRQVPCRRGASGSAGRQAYSLRETPRPHP